jgi:hypothetical protein
MISDTYSVMIIDFSAVLKQYSLTLNGYIMKHFNKFKALVYFSSFTLLTGCIGPGPANTGYGSGIMNNLESSMMQNMVGSVLNGQIGSQLSSADQSFRLQQLNSIIQSGSLSQPQQAINAQTGSSIQINPVGQQNYNTQTQKQCQNMQEVVTLPNGQSITENRIACLNQQTGLWALTQ